MALNYSHRPVLPAHTSENSLLSPLRAVNGRVAENTRENNGECYSSPCHGSQEELNEWQFITKDKLEHCSSPDSNSSDIVDLLPADPFEMMDIRTTVTAIKGWLEDLDSGGWLDDLDSGGYVKSNHRRSSLENYDLFGEWNMIWNKALNFQPFSNSLQVYEKPNKTLDVDEYGEVREMEGMSNECSSTSCGADLQLEAKVEGAAQSEEVPHDAFKFCLMYLGVKELFSVERVSRYLRSEVRGDQLLWRRIHIEQPLNEKITDDILLELASRAHGTLESLSLVECPKISDDAISRIFKTNPRLTKLFVPGCSRLTIEGILNILWTHKSNKDSPGIKFLRIGGIGSLYGGVTRGQFDELKFLLGTDDQKLKSHHKPHFFHRGNFYLPHDDDRVIDIEMCPRCEKFRLVYDCPLEGCRVKDNAAQVCRACTLCVARCAHCGRCIYDNEYEETFNLDWLCSDCFKQDQDKLGLDKKGVTHEEPEQA